ncbi:ornithine cyclodeaminase family protein, partial [Vibrio sp. OPT46]|nr:ornithine cyclodeaminase family protein [Vibrio sp. OPT46]
HTVNPLVTEIGQVITGNAQGRKMDKEITVFDSSGIAIQDLFVAAKLLDLVDRKAAE